MNAQRTRCVAACMSIASMLVVCGQAAGFTPRLERPRRYYVEGYADMWATAVNPTDTQMPFGIEPRMISDGLVDFSAGVIARFDAPSTAQDNPVDGLYDAEFEYFLLQIGDTSWDQTMPGTIQFQVLGGMVTGCKGVFTDTDHSHPDLSFELPASAGTWEALDERDDVNLGTVAGTYALRDGIIPEPATACVLALGGLAVVRRRRR